ncbi:MAG: adenosine kinase [Desulfobacterales bacterium]|jgi:sugar/nucleoside kinase (ribokinase family)
MDAQLKFKPDSQLIVGVGSALVDILTHENEAFLEQTGAVKGGMTLVEKDFIEAALARSSGERKIVPGGSACNTAVGVGRLGGRARFVGKCGNGELGRFIREDLLRQNVEPALLGSDSPTGRVLSIITPDAQRSMFTYLGASSETQPVELNNGCFENAAVVHIEGYLLFNPELMLTAVRVARAAGALISLDLASFTVIEESRDLLDRIVKEHVDIVIANEDEARAFTGLTDEQQSLAVLAQNADIAVVKLGERGSTISHQGRMIRIDPLGSGQAVDSTGAGDLWASGFLYGLVNGYPLERCGRIGSACGYEVCQVIGAAIPEEGWRRIRKMIEESQNGD